MILRGIINATGPSDQRSEMGSRCCCLCPPSACALAYCLMNSRAVYVAFPPVKCTALCTALFCAGTTLYCTASPVTGSSILSTEEAEVGDTKGKLRNQAAAEEEEAKEK